MNRNEKAKYPSKAEIINALKEDKSLKGFDELMVILEFNRKSENIGLIKGELRQNDEVMLRGKLTVFPKTMPNNSMWADLDVDKSIYYGFSLEFKEETLFDLFSEGIRNSIREGKFPFLHR
jgi:hypothetical protein